MSWTDERVELLKKYWTEGLTASQIAMRLGGITRNAVIGKVHRLGLSGRAITTRLKPPRPRPAVGLTNRPPKARTAKPGNPLLQSIYHDAEPYTAPVEEIEIPLNERKSLQDLTESCCRWPIGDPQTPEFHFCNGKKVPGLPYCEHHSRRAFHVPQPRRSKKPAEATQKVPAALQATYAEKIDA